MAKKKSFSKESKVKTSPFNDHWDKYNYYLLYFSIGILIIGYILMSTGDWGSDVSLNISPFIIMIAYIILLPFVIMLKNKSARNNSSVSGKS